MSRNLAIFGLLVVILIAVAFFMLRGNISSALSGKTAEINGQTIKLEIADTDEKRDKGLSDRNSLPEDAGMLFLFDSAGAYNFWMKDMKFPIDIIFLNNDEIVTIYPNVPATIKEGDQTIQNLVQYTSTKPANRVLELNAGKAAEYNLNVGDTITFNL